MIVPQFWAEGRLQHRQNGRQVTVRRFGWSDTSQLEAQAHADQRTHQALERIIAGATLGRREPKVPYNGADGVPIREEIISRQGEAILTRNAYGALCINTPNVFFADIDFECKPSFRLMLAALTTLILCAALMGWVTASKAVFGVLLMTAVWTASPLAGSLHRMSLRLRGGAQKAARQRVMNFLVKNPAWNVRLYRTPAGLRVMASHRTFAPNDPEVAQCFSALGADPVYVRMCLRQQCFRARVSAKPWRIGIQGHLKPRPGVWPVAPAHLPRRSAWIANYEARAQDFAACTFLEAAGSGMVDKDVAPVQQWHDALSKACSTLPIA
jgi:hypothetical protein